MNIKTNNYGLFKYRTDNRTIDPAHVRRLMKSIEAKNMLDLRPIEVDKQMQVIDGQHRLEAAKSLGLDIWYTVIENDTPTDIINLNISKTWTVHDFFNYYVKHKYSEYLKLEDYIKKNQITLKLALAITQGANHEHSHDFRLGKYVFEGDAKGDVLDMCHMTIDFIKKMNGFSSYTGTSRFWMALIQLITHNNFSMDKWQFNLARMVHKFGPRATRKDFVEMFMNCYNWKNGNKIDINDMD